MQIPSSSHDFNLMNNNISTSILCEYVFDIISSWARICPAAYCLRKAATRECDTQDLVIRLIIYWVIRDGYNFKPPEKGYDGTKLSWDIFAYEMSPF